MAFNPPPTGRGYQVHEVISSLQKAIRRSDVEKAVYWAIELKESGHYGWCWNRLREILSEDIGPADRYLPATIHALEATGREEAKRKTGGGGLQLVHAVILMATAEKTRLVAQAAIVASGDSHPRIEIPDEALDRHTRRGKQMGRGFDHFISEAAKIIQPPFDNRDRGAEQRFFRGLHDRYLALRQRKSGENPWAKPEKEKAKPVGGVTAGSSGGPSTHQLPGMGGGAK